MTKNSYKEKLRSKKGNNFEGIMQTHVQFKSKDTSVKADMKTQLLRWDRTDNVNFKEKLYIFSLLKDMHQA